LRETLLLAKRSIDYNVNVRVKANDSDGQPMHGATEQRQLIKETPCSSI
jgi:hypothetical protein